MFSKKIVVMLCLCVSLFILGCPKPLQFDRQENPIGKLADDSKVIEKNTETISLSTGNIEQKASSIKASSRQVEKDLPPDHASVIGPNLQNIEDSSTEIQLNAEKIKTATIELKEASKSVKATSSVVANITAELEKTKASLAKAIADRDSSIHKTLKWVIIGCIFAIAGCSIVFFIYGSKFGLMGAAIAAVILGVASFVDVYFAYLAIAGGIIAVGVLIVLIWQIITHYKALKEVVSTVEIAKVNMTPEEKASTFGTADDKGVMNLIQSPTTQGLVKNIKNNLPSLWQYIKKYKCGDKELEDIS